MSFILGEIGAAIDGTAAFLGAATVACKSAYDKYNETQDRSALTKSLQIVLCAIDSVLQHGIREEMDKFIMECKANEHFFYCTKMYVVKNKPDTTK